MSEIITQEAKLSLE